MLHTTIRLHKAMLTLAVLAISTALPAAPQDTPAAPQPAAASPAVAPASATPERWAGEIELPGLKLAFIVIITPPPPAPPPAATDGPASTPAAPPATASGLLSIPQQGAKDIPLKDVSTSPNPGGAIRFVLAPPGAPAQSWATFDLARGAENPRTASGTMKQGGISAKVTMRLLAEGEEAGPPRPQTPKPPFPYAAIDVTYDNAADPEAVATLAGTLTIPEVGKFGKGPHPAVILISGSGSQDRDSTIEGHKLFAVLADALTRAGVAVLRVDDRGIGGSTLPKKGRETTDDFAQDARAGLRFLAGRPEIDPRRLGIIGHSEGGIIAMMVAGAPADPATPAPAFIVTLAGPMVPGREILAVQMQALARASGVPEAGIARQAAAHKAMLAAVEAGKPEPEILAAVEALVRVQYGVPEGDEPPEAMAEEIRRVSAMAVAQVTSPWMRRFLTLDPAAALRRVTCPILVLNGDKDLQVLHDQNLPVARQALDEAKNPDASIELVANANHLFQRCRTGAVVEYGKIEETIDPATLKRIVEWTAKRAGR